MATHLGGLAAIALSLAVLMAFAWVVRERTGNSGWVDAIRSFASFAVGLVGAGSAPWRFAGEGLANAQQSRINMFVPPPPREGMAA